MADLANETKSAQPAGWIHPDSGHPARPFAEWLNDQRDKDVSQVFHEIMARYAELAERLHACTQPKVMPTGMVLVKAYAECGKFTDDNPGLRADCARKLERGEPCEKCPTRAAQASSAGPDK